MNQIIGTLLTLLALSTIPSPTESCSCLPSHPQETFCNSDFVILATVKKSFKQDYQKIYKVKIRKEFKANEKSRAALKHNRLFSASEESMCGVNLDLRRTYVLSGSVHGGDANVYLCGTAKPWAEVGHRQRKGYRLLFKRGCDCKVKTYFGSYAKNNGNDQCLWKAAPRNCQQQHGICLRNGDGVCKWTRSLALKRCLYGPDHALWPRKKNTTQAPDPLRLPGNGTLLHKDHGYRSEDEKNGRTTYYHYNQVAN